MRSIYQICYSGAAIGNEKVFHIALIVDELSANRQPLQLRAINYVFEANKLWFFIASSFLVFFTSFVFYGPWNSLFHCAFLRNGLGAREQMRGKSEWLLTLWARMEVPSEQASVTSTKLSSCSSWLKTPSRLDWWLFHLKQYCSLPISVTAHAGLITDSCNEREKREWEMPIIN